MATKQIQVAFGAQIGQLTDGVNRINGKFDEMGTRFKALQGVLTAGLAGIAGAFSLNAVKDFAAAMGDLGNLLSDTGQALGLATGEVLRLQNSLTLAGADAQGGMRGFTIFTKSIAEAGDASSRYAEAFRLIGVETRNTDGSTRSFNDVLLDTAAAFSKAPDGPNKTAIAMALFGKSGAALVPYLDLGREGVQRFMQASDDLAGTLKDSTTAQMLEMSAHSNNLKVAFQGVSTSIFESLGPALNMLAADGERLVSAFNRSATEGGKVKAVLQGIADFLHNVQGGFIVIGDIIEIATTGWRVAFTGVAGGLEEIGVRLRALAAWDFSGVDEAAERVKNSTQAKINQIRLAAASAQLEMRRLLDQFEQDYQSRKTGDGADTGGAKGGGEDFGSFGDDKIVAATAKREAARVKLISDAQDAITRIRKKADDEAKAALDAETDLWKKRFAPLNQAFAQSVQGIVQGTTTFKQAWNSAISSMGLSYAQMIFKTLTDHLAVETAKTTATAVSAAARSGSEEAGHKKGLVSQLASAIKSIFIDAAKVFGDVFAWASPFMGPFAAIPAGIASAAVIGATALLPALATGTINVPQDMFAQLHQGEIVVPRYDADVIRSQLAVNRAGAAGGSPGVAAGGGPTTITIAPTYNVAGGGNVIDQLKRHDRDLLRLIKTAIQDNPSLRPT